MIELQEVSWRNFLSYGDYVTSLQLADLGPCLITGEVVADRQDDGALESSRDSNHSNGAGKSTPPNVILWTLFGRTMHAAAPGANVVNWFTKGECWGELKFKNGDRITRTITEEGRTELVWVREGNENRLTADTIATTKLQQRRLNQEFGLDWDIFCGSAFFTQYSRPWMEMTDQARKQAMERILRVDRFTLYGQVAGEKATKLDQERSLRRGRLSGLEADVARVEEELRGHRESKEGFDGDREVRRSEALRRADEAIARRDAVELPDLVRLQSQWDVVAKVRLKIEELRAEAAVLRDNASRHRRDRDSYQREMDDLNTKISRWEKREGKACAQCEQEVPHRHVAGKIEPLHVEIGEWAVKLGVAEDRLNVANFNAKAKDAEAADIKAKLERKLPKLTLPEAKLSHREWKGHDQEAARHHREAEQIAAETNPHGAAISRAEGRLLKLRVEQERMAREVEEHTGLWKHYSYLQKAYSDRRRIKSLAIAHHIPYVNSRLAYYLEVLQLDLRMQFTSSLGIESNRWGYAYYCGGERKRTDLAIMFAMFDLHEKMYGRQANVMVLDEVDGRMDGSGIEALVQIIKNDLTSKVETVLIISHKTHLQDIFPRQIHVRREGRFSQLAEVR